MKKNSNPAPDGHLVSQYLKAVSLSRAAQHRFRGDDKFTNTLKDGYDKKGHVDISRWFLLQACEQRRRFAAIRDRFAFLWQHAIMGRSEDLRERELSDFYACELPESRPHPCPIIVATQLSSKTNKEARPERGVAARHRDVEVCPVGALAMWLHERFDGAEEALDFSARESWYKVKLLIPENTVDTTTTITYDTQAALLRQCFAACAISSSSVTHAMRKGGSRFAYEASCTEDAVRKHGRWCGDRMMERYLTGVALQPVRALAGFSKDGGDYWLPRSLLEPPHELATTIFPWVEAKEAQIKQRLLSGGESDSAALEFLAMLKFLRVVLLQDMAMLQESHPSFPLFQSAPFNTPSFSAFQTALHHRMQHTPTPFETTLEALMPAVCHALAAVRSAVDEIHQLISSATAELKADVRALENRTKEQHAAVMGALGALLVVGQGGARRSDSQARAVQSVLMEGIKTVMSFVEQVQQIAINTSGDGQAAMVPAAASSSAFPALSVASAAAGQSRPPQPSQQEHQQQLEHLLGALRGLGPDAQASGSARPPAVPAFVLPPVRNARVVAFVEQVAEKGCWDGSTVAQALDEQVRRKRGNLSSPLRTMADLLVQDAEREELMQAIMSSLSSSLRSESVAGAAPGAG